MLIEHRGHAPSVHESAYVAPTAVLCGDVVVGAGSRVLHGAVLTAEDGQVRVGRDVVIMENAVVKGRAGHPAVIGDFVLVGPHAHVNGADVRAGAFIATGASLFPGSVVGNGAEIRINGVVQVSTTVEAGSVVPIGWVAVGTPAIVRPPDEHRDIWAVQRDLDFPGTVYGVPRGASMRTIMTGQSEFYGAHLEDVVVGEGDAAADLESDTLQAQEAESPVRGDHDELGQLDEPAGHGDHEEHGEHAVADQAERHEHSDETGPDGDAEHGLGTGSEDHAELGDHAELHHDAGSGDHSEPGDHAEPSDGPEQQDRAEHALTPEPDPAH
jgi:carbonic anhydrase/acetyltransferase-like protein (isoleucine patch superfamily)